jgi:hypothetical protein
MTSLLEGEQQATHINKLLVRYRERYPIVTGDG